VRRNRVAVPPTEFQRPATRRSFGPRRAHTRNHGGHSSRQTTHGSLSSHKGFKLVSAISARALTPHSSLSASLRRRLAAARATVPGYKPCPSSNVPRHPPRASHAPAALAPSTAPLAPLHGLHRCRLPAPPRVDSCVHRATSTGGGPVQAGQPRALRLHRRSRGPAGRLCCGRSCPE